MTFCGQIFLYNDYEHKYWSLSQKKRFPTWFHVYDTVLFKYSTDQCFIYIILLCDPGPQTSHKGQFFEIEIYI